MWVKWTFWLAHKALPTEWRSAHLKNRYWPHLSGPWSSHGHHKTCDPNIFKATLKFSNFSMYQNHLPDQSGLGGIPRPRFWIWDALAPCWDESAPRNPFSQAHPLSGASQTSQFLTSGSQNLHGDRIVTHSIEILYCVSLEPTPQYLWCLNAPGLGALQNSLCEDWRKAGRHVYLPRDLTTPCSR